ncbi:MAG: type II toxin-antitoxin system RelE/ParE family toxin [Candidatus Hydrogenedentes bacterium]|nr:type II toxin-antitoxin system RelE/ParE family toxin [Candidatus Hydrogenedentota bacterium]MBI3118133.1 type II toxin-antitoxin system RelE/ParE family toxin [Candidatus Hydrogenedentota bacterium]
MHVILHPLAKREMREAAAYYQRQQPGLGGEFAEEVQAGVENLRDNPKLYPEFLQGARRKLLSRFPYGLVYVLQDKVIIIVAVAHTSRRPGYWVNRIGSVPLDEP